MDAIALPLTTWCFYRDEHAWLIEYTPGGYDIFRQDDDMSFYPDELPSAAAMLIFPIGFYP